MLETKKGYKKTKLGWIPEEWEYVTLESICSKIGDGLHSTPKYDEDGEYYFINGNNLINNRIVFDEKTKKVGKEEFLKHQKKLNDSTILLSINGTIGNIASYNNEPVILGKSAAYLNIKNKELKHYVAYQLSSFGVNNLFQKLVTGSTIKNLGLKSIQLTKIPLPPLPEQQKIATILRTWDKAIGKLTQLIAVKEQRKKGLMQQLLTGKKRFAEFTDDWKEVKMGEIAEIDKNSLKSNTDPKYFFKYISLSDVNKGTICENLTEYNFSNSPSRAKRIVKSNSVIMATVRPNLQAFALVKDSKDIIVSTGFAVIDHKENLSPYYLIQYLFSKHITNQLEALIVGTNYPAINSSDVRNLKLKLPNIQEQQKIASVLSAADKEIELLKNELESLQQQKKGLMQVLLTGEVRVKIN